MATTKLQRLIINSIEIQCGEGTPNHTARIYSRYFDMDDGVEYVNTTGSTVWVKNSVWLDMTTFTYYADQFDNPDNADWAVNILAAAEADSNNAALTIRAFEDSMEDGVGFTILIPNGVTNIKLDYVARADSAPGGVRTVGLKLYERGIPNNSAVDSWSAGTVLSDIDIPTNENFQYDTQTLTLATLGLTAGQVHQFELTRIAPTAGTNLTGKWDLLSLKISFS